MQVAVWGLGRLGQCLVASSLDSPRLDLVAVVSRRAAPPWVPDTVMTCEDLAEVASAFPDAFVLHANHALDDDLADVLGECASLGLDVVTSSGLFHPESQLDDRGRALDALALRNGTRVLASGVQPGMLLDALPALLLDLAPGWRSVVATKPSYAREWPLSARRMQGIGCAPHELESEIPYPLTASARLFASAVGRDVVTLEERRIAQVAEGDLILDDEVVPSGAAIGFRQECIMTLEGGRQVTLVWEPTVASAPSESFAYRLDVDGLSRLDVRISGTFCDDPYPATAARMVRAASAARGLTPGLHHVTDLGLNWA